ncbi:MAG: Spermidine/putrescine import ABC transporter permease protein PotB [uncultured Nocardioidaceae bacterium]|uniref:Spermidine/putrescine import ABC transporter permease protein PotB n=1 Tax=uncultured Nocardioidaceae bacterium TaxID=253824 RepID=A0A6J4LGF3_9ACTN|nr:MAG: Spermidine/putrescine import ABC transporter permease protein PotB [uncultured Nocardioidaceae bacterium]
MSAEVTPVRGGRSRRLGRFIEPLVLLTPGFAFYAVLVAAPVLLVSSYAFATRGRFGGVEWTWDLSNFERALEPIYLEVLRSSVVLAGIATLVALLLGYPTAYAITKLPPRWRTVALVLVVVPFWTNFLIRMYAWIVLLNTQGVLNDALVATGLVEDRVSMLYTPAAVVVGFVYAYLPLMILPLYASLEKIDSELLEASANLGASRIRTLWSVMVPLTLPGIITGSILVFVPSLGNFVVPELLGGGKTVMVGNLIRDQFLKAQDWPFGSVLAMVVVVALVVLFTAQAWVTRRVEGEPRHG